MTIKIISTEDAITFDRAAHHPLQSYAWGKAREAMGTRVIRLGAFEGENLIDVYSMTVHPIPHTRYTIGYIPRSVLPSAELLQFLLELGKKEKMIFVKIEPDINRSEETENQLNRLQKNAPLVRSIHQLFPDWTMEMDLTPTEDELFANLKSKTRYNIRLASKKGVTVKEDSSDEGFETFIKLYFDTCARQKYYGHDKNYHKTIWNTLKGSLSHILIASITDNGKEVPLAAYELFLFDNKLYYPYGGSADVFRNVMAPNLIMWEAIRFGKAHGAMSFDMWGSSNPNYASNDPYGGFTRFKEGYNTRFVEKIGSYDLIISPALYAAYGVTHRLRTLLLRLRFR